MGSDAEIDQTDAFGFLAADAAVRRADLQRTRVTDEVDENLRAAEVWHETQRRLGHPELRVGCCDAQVAGKRKLKTGADRMALHAGNADELWPAQPREPGLVRRDRVQERVVTSVEIGTELAEHAAVETCRERRSIAGDHDNADGVRQRVAELSQRAPHLRPLCIALVRAVEHHSANGTVNLEPDAGGPRTVGGQAIR